VSGLWLTIAAKVRAYRRVVAGSGGGPCSYKLWGRTRVPRRERHM
jgi:hypothetical protein